MDDRSAEVQGILVKQDKESVWGRASRPRLEQTVCMQRDRDLGQLFQEFARPPQVLQSDGNSRKAPASMRSAQGDTYMQGRLTSLLLQRGRSSQAHPGEGL